MRKKILVVIVLLAVVAAFFSAGPVGDMIDPARRRYEEIESYCQHRECDLADEELQDILVRHPKSRYVSRANDAVAECYWYWALDFLYGMEYQDGKEDYASAIEKAEIIVSRFPETDHASKASERLPYWYEDWSEDLAEKGDYEAAVEKLQAILDKYPYHKNMDLVMTDIVELLLEKAAAFRTDGEYDKAIAEYDRITANYLPHLPSHKADDVDEGIVECYYDWGVELQGEKKFDEALEKYGLIVEKYPDLYLLDMHDYSQDLAREAMASCYCEWATTLTEAGNYEEALEKYNLIIEEYSEYSYAYEYTSEAEKRIPGCSHGLASNLIEEERFEEALQRYSTVLEEYPDSGWASEENSTMLKDVPADVLFDSAAQFKEDGKYNTAIMLYKAVANYHPDSVYAHDAANAAIDTEIEKIYEEQHGTLPPPSTKTEKKLGGDCEVTIVNDIPYELTILISGPANMSITIAASPGSTIRGIPPLSFAEPPEAAERVTITIPPGDYRVAAKVKEPSVIPFYGEWTLTADTSQLSWFYLIQRFG